MERNLYYRIELMFPILDKALQKRIKEEIIQNYSSDNQDAWEMKSDGSYKKLSRGAYSAQKKLLEWYHDL